MTPAAIARLIEPLRRRVMLTVGRAVLHAAAEGNGLQRLQVTMLADETREAVDHVQAYGLASVPLAGAHAVIVCVGGRRDHPVAVAIDDPRFRPSWLGPGETCLYTHLDRGEGHHVVLTADRRIRIRGLDVVIEATERVRVETPRLECTGEVVDHCDDAGQSMSGMRAAYNGHGHPGDAATPPSPQMEPAP
jgi:phage baseplate assembly protein V